MTVAARPSWQPGGEELWAPSDSQLGMILDPSENVQFQLQWPGFIDSGAFGEALRELAQRHDVLQTTYVTDLQGKVWARTQSTACPKPEFIDLRGAPQSSLANVVQTVLTQNAGHAFDLANGPLLRTTVLALDEGRSAVFCAVHHSIFDWASQPIFSTQLRTLYAARTTTAPAGLAAPPMQFRDFAINQRKWLDGPAGVPHIEYWERRLAGGQFMFALPYDSPAIQDPAEAAPQAGCAALGAGYHALRQLALRQRTTMFNLVAAAFLLILGRWSGCSDRGTWITHLGRSRPEHLQLIGCFANFWLLRVDLSGDPTFLEAAARVASACKESLPHREVTLQRLMPVLQRIRGDTRFPSIVFNYINKRPDSPGAADDAVLPQYAGARASPHLGRGSPLALNVQLCDDGRSVTWSMQYAPHLFRATTVARLFGELAAVLDKVAAQPLLRAADWAP